MRTETANFGVRDITWIPWGRTQKQSKRTYQGNENGIKESEQLSIFDPRDHFWVVSNSCVAGRLMKRALVPRQ